MKFWKYKPLLRSTDNYIPAVNTARFLQNTKRILIVGDAGGRDWNYLTQIGKEVYVLDIAPQDNIPNLIVQSIEKKTPFQSEFFDGVVMNEVLEHLWFDVFALNEIYRITKKNGTLVVTVPYMSNTQDKPEYHVRVHSYKTIKRLMDKCGFELQSHFYRGICSQIIKFKPVRFIVYFSMKIVEIAMKKKPDVAVDIVNGILEKIERFMGSHLLTIKIQKLTPSYGGIMCARKVLTKKDFDTIQIQEFGYKT